MPRRSSEVALRGAPAEVEQVPILVSRLLQHIAQSLNESLLEVEVVLQDQSGLDVVVHHVLPDSEMAHEATELACGEAWQRVLMAAVARQGFRPQLGNLLLGGEAITVNGIDHRGIEPEAVQLMQHPPELRGPPHETDHEDVLPRVAQRPGVGSRREALRAPGEPHLVHVPLLQPRPTVVPRLRGAPHRELLSLRGQVPVGGVGLPADPIVVLRGPLDRAIVVRLVQFHGLLVERNRPRSESVVLPRAPAAQQPSLPTPLQERRNSECTEAWPPGPAKPEQRKSHRLPPE
mmetsp:Transcript_37295/g.93650  ORF Transcript_37295/g.93650 Transcript_37295/m.93650 type:complete len:290 (-) Transcript_37295:209-1078(-)